MKMWGRWGMIGLLAAVILTGCGSAGGSKQESAAMQSGAAMDMAIAGDAKSADSPVKAAAEEKTAQAGGGRNAAEGDAAKAGETTKQAEADGGGAAGFVSGDKAADGLSRKIMYKANLTMQVDDYGKTQSEIRDLAAVSGGYILQFSETASAFERGGTFTIKVPASGFSSFLQDLERIGHKSLQRSVQGQDVSEEYVDLAARLKAKQVVETRLIAFMEKATKTDELLSFSNELGKVQEEIERIKGRMRFIDQNVAYSTVEIRVYQRLDGQTAGPDDKSQPVWQRAEQALKASAKFLKSLAEWAIVLLAGLLPLMAVAAVFVIPLWLSLRSRRRRNREKAERQRSALQEHNKQLAASGQNQPEEPRSDEQ